MGPGGPRIKICPPPARPRPNFYPGANFFSGPIFLWIFDQNLYKNLLKVWKNLLML